MKIQFRSTRMDGSQGTWHDVLTPDGYGRRWLAPDQGWSGIEFREVPDDTSPAGHVLWSDHRERMRVKFADEANPDSNPPCTCDGGNSFHGSDCPT